MLYDLVKSFENDSKREQVYFIDCNPSFASYTELGMLVADRLIIPCTGDAASLRAIHNVFRLLYGIRNTSDRGDDVFDQFDERVQENGLSVPKIHCIIQNRSRAHQKKASRAFIAHIKKIDTLMSKMKATYPDRFTDSPKIVCNIKDGNTLASVINHTGHMLGDIDVGHHKIYDVTAHIAQEQKDALVQDIDAMVSLL